MRISARPVRGPLPIQRRSLAHLVERHGDGAQHARRLDQRVAGALGLEVVAGLGERQAEVARPGGR